MRATCAGIHAATELVSLLKFQRPFVICYDLAPHLHVQSKVHLLNMVMQTIRGMKFSQGGKLEERKAE